MHYVNNVLVSTDNLYYTYDVDGTLISMNYNGEEYFYMRNLQQDIIALIDISGTIKVNYEYDAWGNIVNITDNLGINLSDINPYRYRGYRYDNETGWYYLNSRYYNPEISRFINADGLLGNMGDLLSHNMYAYCQNNPVMMVDPSGYNPIKTMLDHGTFLSLLSERGIGFGSPGLGGGNAKVGDALIGDYAITVKTEIGIEDIIDQLTGAFDDSKELVTDAWGWTTNAASTTWNWTKQSGIDTWNWLNGPHWYQTLARDTIVGVIVFGISAIFIPVTLTGVIIAGVGIGVAFVFEHYIWE